VVRKSPRNTEVPLDALAMVPTPLTVFYIRNHFRIPPVDPSRWRLRVQPLGRRKPAVLSLRDLKGLPETTQAVTIECAGNGRTLMSPRPPGTPWGLGAVGTAEFTGTSLRHVLEAAGVEPRSPELLFVGADRGRTDAGRLVPYERSLPLRVALHPDTLLAWNMGGEPLAAAHGSPVRLVVPGWYGMASVKWLVEIREIPEPFRGHFQTEEYVYRGRKSGSRGIPVARMRVRSVIARPRDGEALPRGPVEIAGSAWSGEAPVRSVRVSVNGGRSWSEADLGRSPSRHAAVAWRLRWSAPDRGRHVILAQAIDGKGNSQPLRPVWNALGYGNNAVHRVRVVIR
jgi:DMSO/TMAO reductase YedYZ molybdopterin-dependent catalytic subunit